MLKIGFIVGKTDQVYSNDELKKIIPKKYLVYGSQLHIDIAIAYHIKLKYPHIKIDIILPGGISKNRLKKNDVNFYIGYDCLNAVNNEPLIKKFSTDKGIDELYQIFRDKSCKLFPPFEHSNFTWNKKK